MDDNPTDIGVPPTEPEEVSSEARPVEAMKIDETIIKSEDAEILPPGGPSQRKIEANRRNAKKSTGPRTAEGKAMSSWNSTRHGLLSQRLPLIYGKSKKHFTRLLKSLQQDLEPVGTLEEMLVEKIAQTYWRLAVAAWHEGDAFEKGKPFTAAPMYSITRYQTTITLVIQRRFLRDPRVAIRSPRICSGVKSEILPNEANDFLGLSAQFGCRRGTPMKEFSSRLIPIPPKKLVEGSSVG